MRTISSAAIALAAIACSDGPDPDPDPTPTGPVALVWPVARGDVMARVNAVAERLGLPPVRNDGTELTSDDGDRRLLADYLTGRIRLYAQTPIGLPVTDDDDAIDAAAPTSTSSASCRPATTRAAAPPVWSPTDDPTCAGIAVDPGPRSAWKSCATLAVRVVGMTSDLFAARAHDRAPRDARGRRGARRRPRPRSRSRSPSRRVCRSCARSTARSRSARSAAATPTWSCGSRLAPASSRSTPGSSRPARRRSSSPCGPARTRPPS
jgi:hypothetical protein